MTKFKYFYRGALVELAPRLYMTDEVEKYYKEKVLPRINEIKEVLPHVEEVVGLTGSYQIIFRDLSPHFNGLALPSKPNVAYIHPYRSRFDGILLTLVHECIHLKQFEDKQLEWHSEYMKFSWEGKLYRSDKACPLTYMDIPWERDAIEREPGILKRLKEEFNVGSNQSIQT